MGGGALNLSAVTNLNYTTLTLTNGAATLANVVDITNANFYVTNGATLSLPGVVNCNDSSGGNVVWQAGGTGSVLSLTGLTNLTAPGNYEYSLYIEAQAGGDVELSQVTTFASGEVQVESTGAGSVVDLTRLINYQTANTTLTATNGGVIVLAQPKLTITANNASMTYGGTVPVLTVSYNGL